MCSCFILQHRAGVRLYTSYFYFAKSYVFNKQSLPPLESYSNSSLSPEVTETFCRVPLVLFTLLPLFTQLIYLCWYLYDYCWRFLTRSKNNHKCLLVIPVNGVFQHTSHLMSIKCLVIDFFVVRLSLLQNHVDIRHSFFSKLVYYSCWHSYYLSLHLIFQLNFTEIKHTPLPN